MNIYRYSQMAKNASVAFEAERVEDVILGMVDIGLSYNDPELFDELIEDISYKIDPLYPEDKFLYLNEGSTVVAYSKDEHGNFNLEIVNISSVIERLR